MKRIISILALLMLTFTTLTTYAWADITATVITKSGAQVRDNMYDGAPVLVVIPFGKTVAFENELEYAMAEYNGISGFVKLENFDIDTRKGYMVGKVVSDNGTTLKSSPNDSGENKTVIPVGETVEIDKYSY